jgi:DNA-binding transcriptional ArsR family regulator
MITLKHVKKKKTRQERIDDFDRYLEESLKNAPKIEGFSIKQLAEITETPWPTTRWHLELLESRGVIEHIDVGRAKLYALKKKPKEKK